MYCTHTTFLNSKAFQLILSKCVLLYGISYISTIFTSPGKFTSSCSQIFVKFISCWQISIYPFLISTILINIFPIMSLLFPCGSKLFYRSPLCSRSLYVQYTISPCYVAAKLHISHVTRLQGCIFPMLQSCKTVQFKLQWFLNLRYWSMGREK